MFTNVVSVCVCRSHPSAPAESLDNSDESSSSEEPALDDSSSLSASMHSLGLEL